MATSSAALPIVHTVLRVLIVANWLTAVAILVLLFVLLRRYVLRRGYFAAWTLGWACGAAAILDEMELHVRLSAAWGASQADLETAIEAVNSLTP